MALIVEEEPYAAAVDAAFLDTVCSSCFTMKDPGTLHRCANCKIIHYCSRGCQKKEWTLHKDECAGLVRGNSLFGGSVPGALCRILSRIITRYRRGDHTKVRSFNGRCSDDLMDHYEDILRDADRMENVEKLKKIISFLFTTPGQQITDREFIRFYGRVVINSFGIELEGLDIVGTGVYLGCSALDHSCAPNAFMRFQGNKAVLRSPQTGVEFNDSLRISYVDLLKLSTERKAKLKDYYFTCDCPVCMDTKRDGFTRSIRCKSCSDGVCLVLENTSEIKCETCSAVNDVGLDKVLSDEEEIDTMLEMVDSEESSTCDILKPCVALYKKQSSLLSSLNLKLASLARKIVDLSCSVEPPSPYAAEYSELIVPAFRRLLPLGHCGLANALRDAASGALTKNPPNRKVLAMIQEARDAYLLALGPHDPVVASSNEMVEKYKKRLR